MARPPLPIGTYGSISTEKIGGGFRACTRFRDHDGVTRKVERNGATPAAAKNRLREHLRDRAQQGPRDGLNGDSRFSVAATEWIEGVDRLVVQGQRSPNTAQLYRLNLDTHVLPALAELRLREVTVPRLDRFVQTVQLHKGSATAKIARTVVSGVLGLAVRHGAILSNPVRDVGRIVSTPARQPRALTQDERHEWVTRLHGDRDAVRKDLPDLCEWMLGTGVRIGEALSVSWEEVDLADGTVEIDHTLIRIKGVGLIRKTTKSSAGERTLRLPAFALSMLRRRKLAAGGRGPVFPDSAGGWRDPSNTSRDLRNARGSAEFAWVTSHVFRKTAATEMDRAGLSARQIADQLGHAKVSMTQDRYLGRRAVDRQAADALDRAHRDAKREGDEGVSAG
ncbi:tyrosine-type recombinase/integrase [Pseudonocardia abyssalis]|uniref:Tyrosine-type recombinase/integrase n=1 Tax=Pseudonocardia abyssalis TaxID=2792008 RepID=A0ABS6UKN0_9PSEU|nr:tyrosine-type recombinase/integrase [Pseudonocardia abyssalis]MBW0116491.1 tyrosine-type recombinase/integrase [Pseudonocardia abyssalis]MBW0132817.1 tyrosine-type recombinase/integrase [Pseudonocardia abyssalis]